MIMDFIKKTQIKVKGKYLFEAKVGALLLNKVFIEILAKYFIYTKIFLVKNWIILLSKTNIYCL